jgi:hypothetical protein
MILFITTAVKTSNPKMHKFSENSYHCLCQLDLHYKSIVEKPPLTVTDKIMAQYRDRTHSPEENFKDWG